MTWHGTLLGQAPDGLLVHASLTLAKHGEARQGWAPLTLGLYEPVVRAPMVSGNLQDLTLLPGPRPGLAHFQQGQKFLCVTPDPELPSFSRDEALQWETFLIIEAGQVEALRHLLLCAWLEGDAPIPRGAIRLDEGFNLDLGPHRIDLAQANLSLKAGGDGLCVTAPEKNLFLTRDTKAPPAGITLRTTPPHLHIAYVATEAAFRAASNRRWRLPPQTDLVASPLCISEADWRWTYDRFWQKGDPPAGRLNGSCRIGRARNIGVLLGRFAEGTLFDEQGVIGEDAHLQNLQAPLPPGLIYRDNALELDGAIWRQAPLIRGSHIVFINGNLQNYYHWVMDCLVALDVMQHYAPPEARLLIPGTIAEFRARPINRFDHLAVMHAMGLLNRPLETVPQDVAFARLEEAVWLEDHYIETLPGIHLRAIRDRLLAKRDQRRPKLRIYIRRESLRSLANKDQIEDFLKSNGFSFYALEDMPPEAQIALFQDAEFVVAPHGAGLVNILFCASGTKVLELSPEKEFRPFFWLMSNKLGLSHGILTAPTHDGSFNGMMDVDIGRFARLYQMLSAR